MTGSPVRISTVLGDLIQQFQPCVKTGISLSPDRVSNFVLICATMQKFAISMEQELEAHRIGEADRASRDTLEALAGEQLNTLLFETNGNVIRPIFKKDK